MMHMDADTATTPAKAALATATSVVSAVVSHYSGLHEMIQNIAGIVAIVSGCMAITYYYVGIRERLRNRK